MLKAGLLGLGTIGRTHKAAYEHIAQEHGPVKIEAYFDISKELLVNTGDSRTYQDLDAFFTQEKGKLDYVDICLPTFLHKEVAIKAMRAGFHVLCEKPMALNSQEAQEMCDVAKETGKTLMIAQVMRFLKVYDTIWDIAASKKLGKLRNIQLMSYGSGLPNGEKNWFKNSKLSGGPILDVHIHDIDTILSLLGLPAFVTAYAPSVAPGKCYETFTSTLVYPDGVFVNVFCDWTIPKNKHFSGRNFRFNFEKGYALYMPFEGKALVTDENGEIIELGKRANGYVDEIVYFANCVANHKSVCLCPPEESANSIRLIEAEIRSADQQGEKVFL